MKSDLHEVGIISWRNIRWGSIIVYIYINTHFINQIPLYNIISHSFFFHCGHPGVEYVHFRKYQVKGEYL